MLETPSSPAQPPPPPPPLRCDVFEPQLIQAAQQSARGRRPALADVEAAIADDWPSSAQAACYSRLADLYADIGDYRAELLHLRAAQRAPDDPAVLEAVARSCAVSATGVGGGGPGGSLSAC